MGMKRGAVYKGKQSQGRVQAERTGKSPKGGSASMNGGTDPACYKTPAQGTENKAPSSGCGR